MKKTPIRNAPARTKTPPRRILGTQRGSSNANVNGRRKSKDGPDGGGDGGAAVSNGIQRSVAGYRNVEENRFVEPSTRRSCQTSCTSRLRTNHGAAGSQPQSWFRRFSTSSSSSSSSATIVL